MNNLPEIFYNENKSIKITIGKENLVFAPPINEASKKWGVYAIPRMWRDATGKLIIRFNGEIDSGDTDHMLVAPNLFFTSDDDGKTWYFDKNGEEKYSIDIFSGLDKQYIKLDDSRTIAFREKACRNAIEGVLHQKEFIMPNGEALVYSYRYGDIPNECKGLERLTFSTSGKLIDIAESRIEFDEREILINAKGFNFKEKKYVDVKKSVKQCIFKNTYILSVTLLPDGVLGAIACGQNPDCYDHYNGVVYFLESTDEGKTWKKRSVIAKSEKLPYGYSGDGHEVSLARTLDNTLICVMRMDMSINPNVATPICDAMLSISKDNGHSWCEPFPVADSSVTPHVISLENGVVVLVYGRPGVHFKYSVDNGKTWSKSYSIIGRTLDEYRKNGISDVNSKYSDSCSYSNTFVETLNKDTFLVLYNNLKYKGNGGEYHKAAFVREIKIERE